MGATQTFPALSAGTSQSATATSGAGHVLGGGGIISNPGTAIAAVVATNPTPASNGSTTTGWSATGTLVNTAIIGAAPTITAYVVSG